MSPATLLIAQLALGSVEAPGAADALCAAAEERECAIACPEDRAPLPPRVRAALCGGVVSCCVGGVVSAVVTREVVEATWPGFFTSPGVGPGGAVIPCFIWGCGALAVTSAGGLAAAGLHKACGLEETPGEKEGGVAGAERGATTTSGARGMLY